MIVTHRSNNPRNIKVVIGFNRSQGEISIFCSLYRNSGHSKINFPKYRIKIKQEALIKHFKGICILKGKLIFLNGYIEILFILI